METIGVGGRGMALPSCYRHGMPGESASGHACQVIENVYGACVFFLKGCSCDHPFVQGAYERYALV
eukprot:jgi/Botrbrau1/2876/Bobra.0036s0021.1